MSTRGQAAWLARIGCVATVYAAVEIGANMLGAGTPPIGMWIAMVLWLVCTSTFTDKDHKWRGRHVFHQMLRALPIWARVFWLVMVVGFLAAASTPWIPGLQGMVEMPTLFSLYGLVFTLGSTLMAWARLRDLAAGTPEPGVPQP